MGFPLVVLTVVEATVVSVETGTFRGGFGELGLFQLKVPLLHCPLLEV